jgi:hypothetical protein
MKPLFDIEIDGIPQTVDWLMYCSYAFNRSNSPDVTPERWRELYYYQELYEKIYRRLNGQFQCTHN